MLSIAVSGGLQVRITGTSEPLPKLQRGSGESSPTLQGKAEGVCSYCDLYLPVTKRLTLCIAVFQSLLLSSKLLGGTSSFYPWEAQRTEPIRSTRNWTNETMSRVLSC